MWYHFVVRGEGHNFTFAFVNSAGPVKEGIGTGSPGLISLGDYNNPAKTAERAWPAAIGKGLFDIMDNLPRTDVLLGSIVSLGAAANQQRDIIMYQQHLSPKVYYPGHLTDVAQAGSALYHRRLAGVPPADRSQRLHGAAGLQSEGRPLEQVQRPGRSDQVDVPVR